MRVSVSHPGMDQELRKLSDLVRGKSRFVRLWANAAAIEARGTARAKGGRRWWRELARSVQVRSVSESEAEVSSAMPGAGIKQYGGVIRPVAKKWLTIPLSEEARGKRAYELERPDRRLFVLPGTRLLGYETGSGKDKSFRAMYLLARESKQVPDPWFPDARRVADLGAREARWLLAKEAQRWHT